MQTNGVTYKNDHRKSEEPSKSHNCNMSFKTSRVTYGGIDGAYYTSTRTRKTGSNGVCVVPFRFHLFLNVLKGTFFYCNVICML